MSVGRFLQQAAAGAGGNPVYVDDVFSTYLYDGTQAAGNVIDNGINLDESNDGGGLVWMKGRESGSHFIFDTVRPAAGGANTGYLKPSETRLAPNFSADFSFNTGGSTGFTVGATVGWNASAIDYVSWTFRKQPGFFDIVMYTGNDASPRLISHNLGSVPGMIIVKRTDAATSWQVYHRSLSNNGTYQYNLYLNTGGAEDLGFAFFKESDQTSTHFKLHTGNGINVDGATYVAYLFAHDAQEFGTGSDESIIKCGTYTGNGSTNGPEIDLGFEAQWVLIKNTGAVGWIMADNMRGMSAGGNDPYLRPHTSDAEYTSYDWIQPTASGFKLTENGSSLNSNGGTYIYMAIRRPHKPASEFAATELFKTVAGRSDSTSPAYETGFVTDMGIQRRPATTESNLIFSRLTGNKYNDTDNNSDAEATGSSIAWDYMNGALDYFSSAAYRFWGWKRAPGFFDVVAYTGTGSARTIAHNLGAVPEIIWVIPRSFAERKPVYNKESGNQVWGDLTYKYTGNADSAGAYWNSTTPTESVFSVGNQVRVNGSNSNYVAYLFASVAGISKIGSYTGTGSDIDIDCGFSNGARFVLIKCIGGNAAGNHYYLFDSERGIATGNDPYIVLDDTSTSAYGVQDAIDPLSSGFKVRSTAVDGINTNGGTYLFYAIA
tara:strand:+ start:6487 stop:8463 length:1977 start_codon:yes stop_codon:yes gene_type:complete